MACDGAHGGPTCEECPHGTHSPANPPTLDECVPCPTQCDGCNTNVVCTGCAPGHGGGFECDECPADTYSEGGTIDDCLPCATPCDGCDATTGDCTACDQGYTLTNGECLIIA